jgi:cysteine desulfuration protein SufE
MATQSGNSAPSVPAVGVEDIREAFELFDSWEDRYRFVIDLGKELPAMEASWKSDETLVRGCQSQVWLVAQHDPEAGVMNLYLDSDAHIVRGLIAIVLAGYQRRTPREILDYDIEGLFESLDLLKHLSPTRGNGLRAMVNRIRESAAAYA